MSGWRPGDQVVYLDLWRERVWSARPVRVVDDRDDLLALYLASGTKFKGPELPGEIKRLERVDRILYLMESDDWNYGDWLWKGTNVLMLIPPDEGHAVWVMWDDMWKFVCWYVNLQAPIRRSGDTVQSMDQVLDIVVMPDFSWHLKDEEDFAAVVERGLLSRLDERTIHEEAERMIERIQARGAPFRDGWETWRPKEAWPIPTLPLNWLTTDLGS